jgi:hypothetical protein
MPLGDRCFFHFHINVIPTDQVRPVAALRDRPLSAIKEESEQYSINWQHRVSKVALSE